MVKFWPSRQPLKSCRIQSVTVRSISANDANADECPGTPGVLGHGPQKPIRAPLSPQRGRGVIPSFLSSFLPVQKLGKNLG